MEQKKQDDSFYVLATSSLTEEKTFLLKHDDSFGIFNKYGDIRSFDKSVQGFFHNGTRFLSEFQLKINGQKPLYLSSGLREGNELFSVDLTNPDIIEENKLKLEKGLIHIMRKKILWDGIFYEQLFFYNYSLLKINFSIELSFDANFDDIFEVRGIQRVQKGTKHPLKIENDNLVIGYLGLDQVERRTEISLHPDPDKVEGNVAVYNIILNPGQSFLISMTAAFIIGGEKEAEVLSFQLAVKKHKRRLEFANKSSCEIISSNDRFNHWINRSKADLLTMITETPFGSYPYAGIPWYNTPFGRDGIITALECLWISPEVAKGVLQNLASTQAKEKDSYRDAEPGKILHESRKGEMVELNEIPFKQYYGSIDSTPLFIVLAGAYYCRTHDLETIKALWPNLELALSWIDQYGDIDGDKFVEYERKEGSGLFNQGWKDSHDSVSYSDGKIADTPIALCEVQGYVYDAWLKASILAEALGFKEKAAELIKRAKELKEKFVKEFWSDEKSIYYLALDGDKKPCNIISSNAGHCLFSGIATHDHAKRIAHHLLSNDMFNGWGIRTLATSEARYNPMSYHNGSVWPHDNALIAYGFSKYGLKEEVKKIAAGLFDASLFIEGQRLPELFCGFKRRPGEAPTAYPVACSPQAWSVAAAFMIIQSLLGLEIDHCNNTIRFYKPVLPDFMDFLTIKNLKFRSLFLDIQITKTAESVSIALLNKDTSVKVETIF